MNKIFLLSLLLFSQASGFSAAIHTIIIGDTLDPHVGKPVQVDIPKIRTHCKKIAKYSGLELKETILVGSKVNLQNIFNTLDALDFEKDDAVIFYYSGHGYRTDDLQSNLWPNLYPLGSTGVNLTCFIEILMNKNPRFILALADVCNNVLPKKYAPQTILRRGLIDELNMQANYIKLFVESKGLIISSSSSPGEFSICDEKNGAHFTFFYLCFFDKEMQKEGATAEWDNIFSQTTIKLIEQKPQYQIIER